MRRILIALLTLSTISCGEAAKPVTETVYVDVPTPIPDELLEPIPAAPVLEDDPILQAAERVTNLAILADQLQTDRAATRCIVLEHRAQAKGADVDDPLCAAPR